MKVLFLRSLGLAFISSSLGTILWLLVSYEEYFNEVCASNDDEKQLVYRDYIQKTANGIGVIFATYKFLPLFLLLAYIAFIVDRWRTFMIVSHTIQGNIHDIAMTIGGVLVTTPVDDDVRKKMYKIYRYVNVAHLLCYKSFSRSMKDFRLETDFVERLKLLTFEEAMYLLSTENKMRDATLTLLTKEVASLVDNCQTNSGYAASVSLFDVILALRGNMSKLHDLFTRDNPNEYVLAMELVAGTYTALITLSYPFLLLVYTGRSHSESFQPIILIGLFCVMLTLQMPFTVTTVLRTPFGRNGIRADSLLASTERTIFITLRTSFHMETKNQLTFKPDERLSKYLVTGKMPPEEELSHVERTRALHERASVPIRRRGNMMNQKKGGFGEL